MKQTRNLTYTLPPSWETAVADWLIWLTAGGSSPATRKTRRTHVRSTARELGSAHPREVTTAELVGILGRDHYSIEHRRGLRGSLASFYRWCLATGVVTTDISATLPRVPSSPPAPRPATDQIWETLLADADARTILMARLACEAGLRRAEVAQVSTNDLIAGIDGYALVVHGKGGKQRVVPITTTLADRILAATPGYLFPGLPGRPMSADRVGKLVSAAMPPHWSMHKLRHRYATRGYAGTGNLRAVQEALGHASVATTQRYTAISAKEIRSVSEAAAWSELGRGA